jgi:hypothetical protein
VLGVRPLAKDWGEREPAPVSEAADLQPAMTVGGGGDQLVVAELQ